MSKKILNIGILSHVDAGKTTITENFLYLSGATRAKGSVDAGTTVTDSTAIERKRGISVKTSPVSFEWRGITINLLDTPGHVDFSAEVERVLNILDGAIVVVSAVEGVQSHTITLVEILKKENIPFIIFINKIDREGADIDFVLRSLKEELNINILPIVLPDENLNIIRIWDKKGDFSGVVERICEHDDDLMLKYIEEEDIAEEDLRSSATKNIKKGILKPVLTGIAKKGIGIKELLDASIDYLYSDELKFYNHTSAYVYKVEYNEKHGKLAHIRVFSGKLSSKEVIFNNRLNTEIKIGVLKKNHLHKLKDVLSLDEGEIGIITGAEELQVGDYLGVKPRDKKEITMVEPVMTTVIKPIINNDFNHLKEALIILNYEDPALNLIWYNQTGEFHINIAGPIQIEIIEDQLKERFGLEATFENPIVIYKERPMKAAQGFVRYWMPKPCWAIMTFEIEPRPKGSGIVYNSLVRQSDIHQKYQNEIERTIPKVLKQGIKGWEVTDIKISLISGEDHKIHSRSGDFELATFLGIMRALDNAGTELLEPILDFTIKAPKENLGKIASDLTRMRGVFANPKFKNGFFTLSGKIPVATSLDYSIKLSSMTSGKGRISVKFDKYDVCPPNTGIERGYIGVNPLDEAQWILHRRGAFKAEKQQI